VLYATPSPQVWYATPALLRFRPNSSAEQIIVRPQLHAKPWRSLIVLAETILTEFWASGAATLIWQGLGHRRWAEVRA
jgi:hypothetical protein